ncbi:c-type cytochrome [Catenovulum agarivorans]|uniref:c-type cytochrome n=1 Tax=Catenovulum agarivorans TaxID=1172192 RepID=UPI003B42DA1C
MSRLESTPLFSEYNLYCGSCHTRGAMGAPRLGRYKDWNDRTEHSKLVPSYRALAGIGRMPAKGGNHHLSDEEFLAISNFLVSSVEMCNEY